MAGRLGMALVLALLLTVTAHGQDRAGEVRRFDARLQADAALLSPGEQGRLAWLADRGEGLADLRGLDAELSFAWTELPGGYAPLAGPWPVTATLTLPGLYAPDGGGASIPTVWAPTVGDWPQISR